MFTGLTVPPGPPAFFPHTPLSLKFIFKKEVNVICCASETQASWQAFRQLHFTKDPILNKDKTFKSYDCYENQCWKKWNFFPYYKIYLHIDPYVIINVMCGQHRNLCWRFIYYRTCNCSSTKYLHFYFKFQFESSHRSTQRKKYSTLLLAADFSHKKSLIASPSGQSQEKKKNPWKEALPGSVDSWRLI